MTGPRRTARRAAFIDTSAFYALTGRDDANHRIASTIIGALQRLRWTPYTSTYVIAEQHALHLARLGHDVALRALTLIDRSDTRVIRVSPADERCTREILTTYTDKDFSFTDAASFSIMERLGIQYAFTFDRDFSQYGFTPLTPDIFSS